MGLKELTPEERTKLQQENPEEYARLAAEDAPKGRQAMRFVNGQMIAADPTAQVRYVNGRLVQG